MLPKGKIVWVFCFALLLVSSPLAVRDLASIRQGIERARIADAWYDGQIQRELLRLKLALIEARSAGGSERDDEVQLHLDLAFSRLSNLPTAGAVEWQSDGIATLAEIADIRKRLNSIDAAMPLLRDDRPRFLGVAIENVEAAIERSQELSVKLMQRQNRMYGEMEQQFENFQNKLVFYGVAIVVLTLGLFYLMRRHISSERNLRAANRRLTEFADRLALARDEAVRANEAKGTFLANVSHELRTPLNAIVGFSEMLEGGYCGGLNARQNEYVGDISRSAQRLLLLISDILDLSKVEAGKYDLAEQVVDFGDIIRRAAHDMREQVREAELTVEVEVAPNMPMLRADPMKLRQIVDNLLSNAVKFTDVGGAVRLRLVRLADGPVRLTVTDTGIGIAADEIAQVFEAFQQATSTRARQRSGSGLGLSLVKGFAELHGGAVQIRSQPGVGTTVTVDLPAGRIVAIPLRLTA